MLLADNVGARDFAHERHSEAPEGASTGGGVGAAIGGGLGLLTGLGVIALPIIGQYLTAGPVMDALAGAGAFGVLGGIAVALSAWAYRSSIRVNNLFHTGQSPSR